jgi:hypothetical protein
VAVAVVVLLAHQVVLLEAAVAVVVQPLAKDR